jgi:hypothetical protein
MTAREDEYFTDVEILYCKNCAHVAEPQQGIFTCTNESSDHCEHLFGEEHLACNVEHYGEKPKPKGKCKNCRQFESLNEDGLCYDCE